MPTLMFCLYGKYSVDFVLKHVHVCSLRHSSLCMRLYSGSPNRDKQLYLLCVLSRYQMGVVGVLGPAAVPLSCLKGQ